MRHLESRWGEVRATMETLGELTGYSRSSVHRAVESLVELGWVKVKRTKRNYGLWNENRYTILRGSMRDTSKAQIEVNEGAEGRVISDTTTRVLISTKSTNNKLTSNLNNSNPSDLGATAPRKGKMVNKWKDEDSEIGGVGLLGSTGTETPQQKKRAHRSEKPIESWSGNDVASEFASRVYEKVRGIPGLVNTSRLAIALNTNRKKFGITASQEMGALEKFFADERNLATIKKFPKNSHGIFLNSITKYVSEFGEVEPSVDTVAQDVYVYASDGKEFDNSMPGRMALQRYETKLKG